MRAGSGFRAHSVLSPRLRNDQVTAAGERRGVEERTTGVEGGGGRGEGGGLRAGNS